MSFNKCRFNQYELIRFCSSLNTTVVGGESKLLNYFEKTYKPESIITFVNRRWSMGTIFEKLNFKLFGSTVPNHFYFRVNENILFSRTNFEIHKLENFDSMLSETENMYNHNYRKIYDSGNLIFIKKF